MMLRDLALMCFAIISAALAIAHLYRPAAAVPDDLAREIDTIKVTLDLHGRALRDSIRADDLQDEAIRELIETNDDEHEALRRRIEAMACRHNGSLERA